MKIYQDFIYIYDVVEFIVLGIKNISENI